MRVKFANPLVALLFVCFFNSSCQKEYLNHSERSFEQHSDGILERRSRRVSLIKGSGVLQSAVKALAKLKSDDPANWVISKANAAYDGSAVDPVACGPTGFSDLVNNYLNQFGSLEFQFYGTYVAINQLYTIADLSDQYFGADGENTHLVEKHRKKLENFWDMPGEVRIDGEHNSALNDREKIASVYILVGLPEDLAYQLADQIMVINAQSPVFIETPLISFDAFARTDNLIVLGDGIIQVLGETGIDNDVVVAGVLSHEWAHQVQFNNSQEWFGGEFGSIPLTPEFTRLTELEADFFSAYYLTHKRGATYNWKRVSEFLDLFFSIGDCQFGNPGHHGTPDQRLSAARLGYNVANDTFPRGHILSADDLNSIFMDSFDDVIANNIP